MKLDAGAPLSAAPTETGLGEAVLNAFRATNLLLPFEQMRIQDALRGPNADRFVRGAATFASGEIKAGLREMEVALKPHDAAKWTVITYLPYLWRPEQHMFLKPAVTQNFASRVGHSFVNAYSAALDPAVYCSLLDLAATTERELQSFQPRDRIDIQSFIWVVGKYDLKGEEGLD